MFLFVIFLLSAVSCGNSLDPFMFEVKNPNQTIQYLKQFDYENTSLYLTNFLLSKMLRQDIQEDMIPSYLWKKFKRSVKIPTRIDLRKSATIMNDQNFRALRALYSRSCGGLAVARTQGLASLAAKCWIQRLLSLAQT